MNDPEAYPRAIVRNAEWFLTRQRSEGHIDAEGDEFYGIRGDATLVGHSVSVRLWAYRLTGEERFLSSARSSLEWLAARQDPRGGWRRDSAFTLDGAQCVFEGFHTYRRVTGDSRFDDVLVSAADRMIHGTLDARGGLLLPNIIEIGEYAHFAFLAWKTLGETRFRAAAERVVDHITSNFDDGEGFWYPFDRNRKSGPGLRAARRALGPPIRAAVAALPLRGRLAARLADHLLPLVAAETRPQYAMSLMDAEPLLDTLDGSCALPELRAQAKRAVEWALRRCRGPFAGTLVESRALEGRRGVYPLSILNDSRTAATWPTACLALACCGLASPEWAGLAWEAGDAILAMQAPDGAFFNFRRPDGSFPPLQSGNVNFYASMALWMLGEVYGHGPALITRIEPPSLPGQS